MRSSRTRADGEGYGILRQSRRSRPWSGNGRERELLHIVDLDGAFAGEPKNRSRHRADRQVDHRSRPSWAAASGTSPPSKPTCPSASGRVILGTAAQRNPELVEEACRLFPGRIVVGIDAKDGMVAVQGWAEVTGVSAVELAKQVRRVRRGCHYLHRHQPRRHDAGTEHHGHQSAGGVDNIPVIASGGVSSLTDIENLMAIEASGITGVITGKAIYYRGDQAGRGGGPD